MIYAEIATALGLSINTVKGYGRRKNLSKGSESENASVNEDKEHCKFCGKKLIHTIKAKSKRFCDAKCRLTWWNRNRDQLKHKNINRLTCAHCGVMFTTGGNLHRKYCSHNCYIKARFWESSDIKEAVAP